MRNSVVQQILRDHEQQANLQHLIDARRGRTIELAATPELTNNRRMTTPASRSGSFLL